MDFYQWFMIFGAIVLLMVVIAVFSGRRKGGFKNLVKNMIDILFGLG